MLRLRIALVVLAVFVFYGVLEYGLNRLVVVPNFVRLEQESAKRDIARCQEAFRREVDRVGAVAFHCSTLRDVRLLLANRERAQIGACFPPSVFYDNRVDMILYVGAGGEVVWQGQCGADSADVAQLNPDVVNSLLPRFTTFAGPRDRTAGLVVVSGETMAVASHPIATSEGGVERITGSVIVGRRITAQVLSGFVRELQIPLDIWPLRESGLPGGIGKALSMISPETPNHLDRSSPEWVKAYTTLSDVDGQAALLLRASLPREVMKQGLRAVRLAMLSVGITGVALLLLVLGVLETMVVSRISRIAETMSRIGKTGDMAIRLPVVGKDEISLLSEDVNRMLGDLQKAEESLRDNERRYRALFENAGDALVVLKDQQVMDCNTRAMALFGGSREQIVGHPFASLLPPMQAEGEESRALWDALMDKVRSEGASVAEWRCRRLDGSIVETEMNLSMVTMGSEVLLQMVFRDLTVRRQVEADKRQLHQQMVQGQKLESLGILAGGIAHDFNNLLVAVMGNADLALQDMEQSAPGYSFVEEIKRAAVRASDLTSQLLAYSGKGKFVIKVVDLNLIVREMANLLQVSISKKAIVRYDLAETLPSVEVDVAQFRQILMNLITNASDAIGDTPGTITIRTGIVDADRNYLSQTYINEGLQEGAYAFLEVSDTGCGMDAETRGRIFDPFFTTKASGRGLGLAAVLGIVRGHRGAIHVYSEPGRGSTFKVLLPLSEKEIEHLPQSIITGAHFWQASGTILVADDEESMRSISRMILEKIGFRVVTAVDGQDAVDKFREHADSVVAVLLDLTMPRLNGEQTFEQLLCIRPDVKVVLCSGYNESEACRRFGGTKLAGFVQKPFEYHALVNLLKDVVIGKRA